jgi:hypothetical protein
MVAVMLCVAATSRDAGTVLNVTARGLELLLHATRAAIMVKQARRRSDLRNVIGHLR